MQYAKIEMKELGVSLVLIVIHFPFITLVDFNLVKLFSYIFIMYILVRVHAVVIGLSSNFTQNV